MLILFACPKPFTDPHIATIQTNAITSWTLLRPKPKIILFGDEPGVAEICDALQLVHVPEVVRSGYGTPLLNGVFRTAEQTASSTDLLCYINADILLMSDCARAISQVESLKSPFLMGGRPWNVDITARLSFDAEWEGDMHRLVERTGVLRAPVATDYFLFRAGFWGELPPFILGRPGFDNALLYRARKSGAQLIDATRVITAVHQNHSYPAHVGVYDQERPEATENRRLAGGYGHLYSWRNATHRLTAAGPKLYLPGLLWPFGFKSRTVASVRWAYSCFLASTRPFRSVFTALSKKS